MNGILTIEDIRERCVIDEDTGCWIWRRAVTQGSGGVTPVTHLPALRRVVTVMRAVLHLQGVELSSAICAWSTCRVERCCAPAHILHGTKAEYGRAIKASGRYKGLTAYRIGSRKHRKNHTPPEIRSAIMQSTETGRVVAVRLGVSESTVSRIRLGKVFNPLASVFARRA